MASLAHASSSWAASVYANYVGEQSSPRMSITLIGAAASPLARVVFVEEEFCLFCLVKHVLFERWSPFFEISDIWKIRKKNLIWKKIFGEKNWKSGKFGK